MIFEPNGMTDDKDIRIAQSLVDYLARRLAIDYLDVETRQALGIKTTAERTAEVNGPAEPALAAEPAEPTGPSGSAGPAPAPVPVERQQPPAAATGGTAAPAAPQAPAFTPGMAAVDAPYCSTCGVRMRPAGSCFVCESCGTTSGCS
jgi:ribonucleoside-diphosphate reductase alpha chain